jgi:hypothetical protein
MKRAALATLAIAAAAHAQTGEWVIQVDYEPGSGGVVSPAHPTATVRILAGFTGAPSFAGGDGDLLATDGHWGLNPLIPDPPPFGRTAGTLDVLLPVGNPPGRPPPGMSGGFPVGSDVEFFVFGLIAFTYVPPLPSPMPLWEAVWTTDSFSPRTAKLRTDNTDGFYLYDQWAKAFKVTPTHGSAQIRIVPSPATALTGAAWAVLVCALRRRPRRDRAVAGTALEKST